MGRMYGFANIGLLGGFITTIHHLGGGLWAYLGGAVYDATGSYTVAMAISAAASAVALVCTLLIKEVRHVAPDEGAGAQAAEDLRLREAQPAGAADGVRWT